jgi:hypothetical protein
MVFKKAKVQYIDANHRAVVITEDNEAVVLFTVDVELVVGQDITIKRLGSDKRMSDWKIGEAS